MSKAKKFKSKGRPPKYVRDDEGKEIVGLSCNKSNKMYYATGTKPRYYICGSNRPKDVAIELFNSWKQKNPLTPEEHQEQKRRDEIYLQARRLVEDGFLDDLIEKKARELIKDDKAVREELLKRAKELVTGERSVYFGFGSNERLLRDKFEEEIKSFITQKAKEQAGVWVQNGDYDRELWERAYDLITDDPVKAAKILGIPGIAYIGTNRQWQLTWNLAWDIFYSQKSETGFLYEKELYGIIRKSMNYLDNMLVNRIKYAEFYDAFENEDNSSYCQISKMDRLIILEDVFETVRKAGHGQANLMLKLIREYSRKL